MNLECSAHKQATEELVALPRGSKHTVLRTVFREGRGNVWRNSKHIVHCVIDHCGQTVVVNVAGLEVICDSRTKSEGASITNREGAIISQLAVSIVIAFDFHEVSEADIATKQLSRKTEREFFSH